MEKNEINQDLFLMKDERMDKIGFENLRLIQKPGDFCYGIDAVILADFAAACEGLFEKKNTNSSKNRRSIIDLGTGTGIIPIILSCKTKAKYLFGVELQKDSFERANRNVLLNDLGERIKMFNGDVNDKSMVMELRKTLSMLKSRESNSNEKEIGKRELDYFDMVTTNPPYVAGSCGIKSENEAKMAARHETTGSLCDFIRTGSQLLKEKGDFYMVHRPSRIVDICCLCRQYKLEPKELRFVSPNKDSKPNILLIHCVKNGGAELKFLNPLYVYNEKGNYTDEINRIYERVRDTAE